MSTTKYYQKKYDENNFDKFMLKHLVKNGEYTHTYMAYPYGKFFIPDNELYMFYEKYTYAVIENKDKNKIYSLTEKHQKNFGPLIVDFDFRYNNSKRLINDTIIEEIVKSLTNILKTMFSKKANYICYVLQRPTVYPFKDFYKDGLHLQFPYLVFDYKYHYVIRLIFIENLKNILKNLDIINSIEDIYDKCVIEKNNWCMYGSTKPNADPYQIYNIYNNLSNHNNQLDLVKILSIQDKKNITKINKKRKNEMDIMWDDFNKPKKVPLNKLSFDNIITNKMINTIQYNNYKSIKNNDEPTLDKVQELLKLINCYNDYQMWLNVGMILHNIDDSYESLNIWDEWSRQSIKYESDECAKKWNTFKNISSGLTIASLYYYAKNY